MIRLFTGVYMEISIKFSLKHYVFMMENSFEMETNSTLEDNI